VIFKFSRFKLKFFFSINYFVNVIMDAKSATPMLRQYLEIKKQYPGTLLFFRMGDFYEMFNEDAVTGACELEITLTARQKDSSNPIPMCGVPHHAASNYIARLIKKGYRVAICEQTEEASPGKKLVRREVVRVITPGTAIDPQLVESRESVYLAAVCATGETFGAAFLEVSTGEFFATQITGTNAWAEICADLESYAPREILFPEYLQKVIESTFVKTGNGSDRVMFDKNHPGADASPLLRKEGSFGTSTLTPLEDSDFLLEDCANLLKHQLNVKELDGFGLQKRDEAIRAAGACLRYAQNTQRATAAHISGIQYFEANDFMVLDGVTLKNLEVVESNRPDAGKRSLLGVMDATVTSMGGRLLRSWLLRPSIKRSEIQTRLTAVTELGDSILRDKLRFLLKEVSDLERLVGRLNLGTASPRDLLALNRSLNQIPEILFALSDAEALLLQVLRENIFELPHIQELIAYAISDDAPLNLADGGVIRDGFSAELDELRNISRSAKQIIASFEEDERKKSGIGSLRVKFNNVLGYFIEVSKANAARVPDYFERRQTLTNAERYTTPQLKEWEQKVLGAEEKIATLEQQLFQEVRAEVTKETRNLQSTARALATLDGLAALAETAARRNYVSPVLHDGDEIEIKGGRHPIVEAFTPSAGAPFIPNDLYLNNSTDRLLIITGPNMGGKSTILRQAALIQILAQIGSFVPATYARLPMVDRIWTRVGASDDLAGGRSTFMVEMTETAAILHNATPRSLILLDEVGRGTSTFDGLSIAWAVAEYLHDSNQHAAKTLFATHYHELTELAEKLPGAKNYQVTAAERDGEVVFLHKLEHGKASKSYGIAVAQLAGLPADVLARAREVLEKLECYEIAVFSDEAVAAPLEKAVRRAAGGKMASQTTLFQMANDSIIDEIRELPVEDMSAEELRSQVKDIKNRIV
jgi:DNA mismatch repair protein MutS